MLIKTCKQCRVKKTIGSFYTYNNEEMCRTCLIGKMEKSETRNEKILAHLLSLEGK